MTATTAGKVIGFVPSPKIKEPPIETVNGTRIVDFKKFDAPLAYTGVIRNTAIILFWDESGRCIRQDNGLPHDTWDIDFPKHEPIYEGDIIECLDIPDGHLIRRIKQINPDGSCEAYTQGGGEGLSGRWESWRFLAHYPTDHNPEN